MSSPTLTFTPAMFYASLTGIKDTTRRLIIPTWVTTDPDSLGAISTFVPFVQEADKWCYRSASGLTEPIIPAHSPGQIKPMVTSWRINGSFDDPKSAKSAAPSGVTSPASAAGSHPGNSNCCPHYTREQRAFQIFSEERVPPPSPSAASASSGNAK
ncbi:MAG: hypothetical protein WAW39_28925 [Prosthecobacter sp.]|uniref:hypothetical protein n=1 Tax=Prosthecobacter sp. TaxID=1965333 RepID=UPI003BAF6047